MTIHSLRRAVATILCAALMAASPLAMAQENSSSDTANTEAMMPDLLILRPVALVGTMLGAALFVVALPFSLPSGSVEKSAEALVVNPLEYTFNRRLGDFDHCGATRHACGDD